MGRLANAFRFDHVIRAGLIRSLTSKLRIAPVLMIFLAAMALGGCGGEASSSDSAPASTGGSAGGGQGSRSLESQTYQALSLVRYSIIGSLRSERTEDILSSVRTVP